METAPNLFSWPLVVAAMFLAVIVLAAIKGIARKRRERDGRHALDGRRMNQHRPLNR